MLRRAEVPVNGTIYAAFTDHIIFGKYQMDPCGGQIQTEDGRIDVERAEADGSLLELHLFDQEREYRCIKTRKGGYREYLISDATEHDDLLYEEVYLTGKNADRQDGFCEKVAVVNYICYSEDDLIAIPNYRLKEVE